MKFYVGQRVRCLVDSPDDNRQIEYGSIGTVCNVGDDYDAKIGVSWDGVTSGHSCGGSCEDGPGWYVAPGDIVPIEDEADCDDIECDESALDSLLGEFFH